MENVRIKDDQGVRLVTMDRPDALNAFNNDLMDELTDAFLSAAADNRIKALVLTGAGRAFSAGADLTVMGKAQATPKHGFAGLLEAIVDFPKPFILAINGVGAGIGATICGLADLSFISEKARLRAPFSTLGVTAEAGSTLLLPLLMGRQRASWFLLSAEWMDAEACVDAGLALKLCPADELMPCAMEHALKLAKLPLVSLQTTKKLMMDPLRDQLRAVFAAENAALASLVGGAANREAVRAFRDKREPDFSQF